MKSKMINRQFTNNSIMTLRIQHQNKKIQNHFGTYLLLLVNKNIIKMVGNLYMELSQ